MSDIVIGARQFPNPKGIKPTLDTDASPKRPSTGVQMNSGNYYKGDSGMDTSNPEDGHVEPKKHPIDELFGRGIKRSHGRSIPKADVTISDN